MLESSDLKKAIREEKQILQSLDRLLVGGIEQEQNPPKVGEDDALWVCFDLILNALGVSQKERPSQDVLSQRGEFEDTIELLCEHAQIRSRQVKLAHLTTDSATGPILALKKGSNTPVVILSDLKKGPRLVDVVDGKFRTISSLNPEELHPLGYYFYRPLPKTQLGYTRLLRWALQDSGFQWGKIVSLALIASLLVALYPLFVALLVDHVMPTEWLQGFHYFIVASIIIVVAHFFITLSLHQRIGRSMQRMSHDTQAAIVDRLLELSVAFHRQSSAGEIAYRAFGIDALRQFLSNTLVVDTLLASFSFVNFFVLFYYSPVLSLWVMGSIGIYAVAIFLLFILFQRSSQKIERSRAEMAGLEFQILSGISKIRAAGAERRMFARWLSAAERQKGTGHFAEKVSRLIAIINSTSEILVLGVVLIAFNIHETSDLSMGEFLAFLLATLSVSSSVFQLGRTILAGLNALPLVTQMRPIIESTPEATSTKNDPGILSGKIDLMHVSFRYDEGHKQVLFDVNLSVEPGDFVALVGASGSGKSTLLKLLLGFNIPTTGAIFFDGQDLNTLSIQKVRKQMGVVLQQGHLFPGSILDNIVGSSLLTVEDAWKAAERCALDEDIRKFPMGMYTMIGEGAGGLSGGQKQRILIARAIARNPKILLFDEATSALDNVTQEVVTQSLNQLNVTRIVIAHRISTIRNANKICVLKDGRIVEQGSYEELLAANGAFAELASRQVV